MDDDSDEKRAASYAWCKESKHFRALHTFATCICRGDSGLGYCITQPKGTVDVRIQVFNTFNTFASTLTTRLFPYTPTIDKLNQSQGRLRPCNYYKWRKELINPYVCNIMSKITKIVFTGLPEVLRNLCSTKPSHRVNRILHRLEYDLLLSDYIFIVLVQMEMMSQEQWNPVTVRGTVRGFGGSSNTNKRAAVRELQRVHEKTALMKLNEYERSRRSRHRHRDAPSREERGRDPGSGQSSPDEQDTSDYPSEAPNSPRSSESSTSSNLSEEAEKSKPFTCQM